MSRSIVQMFFCVITFKSQLSVRVQNTAKKFVKKITSFDPQKITSLSKLFLFITLLHCIWGSPTPYLREQPTARSTGPYKNLVRRWNMASWSQPQSRRKNSAASLLTYPSSLPGSPIGIPADQAGFRKET